MKEKTESETRDHRWIAISGLLFVAAWVAGLFVASPPVVTTPMAHLIASYEANRQMVMVQAYLTNGLTGILLMAFVAALQSALHRAEGESSTFSNLLLVAGTVVTSLSCLEALCVQVVANHIAATHDAAVIRTLLELNAEIDTFQLPILGIMIAAASWLSWRVQALPPWLVWVGAVEALLLVVASGNSLFPGRGPSHRAGYLRAWSACLDGSGERNDGLAQAGRESRRRAGYSVSCCHGHLVV